MNKDNLKRYIKIVKNTGTNEPLKNAIVGFLETYDGTNVEELNILVFALLTALIRMDDLEIKEEAFEALQMDQEIFENDIKEIKRRYNELLSGKLPPDIPLASGASMSEE